MLGTRNTSASDMELTSWADTVTDPTPEAITRRHDAASKPSCHKRMASRRRVRRVFQNQFS